VLTRLKAHDRGLRQSELLALTWADVDLDGAKLTVHRSKTRSGVRDVALDAGTVDVLRRHRKRQLEERLAAFGAYDDHGLLFCREDGSPFPYRQRVTFDFKRRARELGLPVIRFHDVRHTGPLPTRPAIGSRRRRRAGRRAAVPFVGVGVPRGVIRNHQWPYWSAAPRPRRPLVAN
jgi:integrase